MNNNDIKVEEREAENWQSEDHSLFATLEEDFLQFQEQVIVHVVVGI